VEPWPLRLWPLPPLFNPLRRRVQRLVDRRFNRARYTICAGLRDVVDHAIKPTHVSLWIKP
jgi:hypothetical protein